MAIIFSKHIKALRVFLLLLFMLSSMGSTMWGADVKYYIINNNGKVCFQYVIKDGFTYTSIDKTKLCVHPWARSMVATNFRFYATKDEAVADAAGTQGAYFEEGTTINSETTGTGPFYVRYSMKTQQELESEGYVYDPDGKMAYLVQIRERNTSGRNAKRRQIYFDAETNDQRFEFGLPGSNRTDIPDNALQTDVPYRFRFDTKGDAYGVYIYNGAGEGIKANGVLTVQNVGRDAADATKQKDRVTYENIISDYDPETSNTLQTFFFVSPNEHIMNSWSGDSWTGKVFLVGALGGLDYWMRDKGNKASGGNDEANVPYMLCANGNPKKTGEFTGEAAPPNGYQFQCFRSWRNYDPTIDNIALIKTTPYEETHEVTYHIVNRANTTKDVLTIVQRHGPSSRFSLFNRDKLQRLGCTLSTDYFSDRDCSNEHKLASNALVGDATDVYIPYTFDAEALSTATTLAGQTKGLEFSTEENPKWYSLTIRENNPKKLVYDATNNVINSSGNSSIVPDDATRALQTAQYAFIGDPYSFHIICKSADGKYAYVNPETLAYNNTADNVCFTDSPTDNLDKFAMVAGTTGTQSFQIFQRDKYAYAYRAFWEARGSGNQIRMYAQTSGNEIVVDHNLHATPTPEYSYTYNIVDNSGRIAIKYTVTQEVSHRLDGEHGHKAIPSAIYSPYLEGETLTFYKSSTLTEGNKITQLPNTAGDIFVRYTQELHSSRMYPLDGTKSYFMQLGDRYVVYNSGVATQETRPNFDDSNKNDEVWILSNSVENPADRTPDPYDVCIRNVTNNFNLWDNTEIHFILMGGAGTSDGQIELLFASGADLSSSTSTSLTLNSTAVAKATTVRGSAAQQVIFSEAVLERTYRLIDKQGKILLEYESTELENAEKLDIPAKWRSPLISYPGGYKYWKRSDFTITGDIYTLTGETQITAPAQSTDGYIYVTYDAISDVNDENYVDMNSAIKDIDARVARSASDATKVRDASKLGQLYMLKFTTSDGYYLEDGGDNVETTLTASGTNVYPYTNGDGPFYIYTQARWDSQKGGGASTRTRWPWYIFSPNNDPYHVMVTSWQQAHANNDIRTSYYSYLHTYYNTKISQVVTNNVTDDPRTVDTGGERIMPTEYMLLGTKDHYKLVTSEEIGTDGSGYETTNHRVLNSFEQYWRNNPTALWKKAKAIKGSDLTQEEKDALKKGQSALATDDAQLATNGWHNYKSWVNAAPWDGSSKKYTNDDHWFMTVNVGSGEFELIPTEIDAVLVLLDNHGWEIMRSPIVKSSDASRYAAVKEKLRKWDSPMVKEYKFYATRNVDHKVKGYHRYNIYDNYNDEWGSGRWLKSSDIAGRGTSLADYPQKFSGDALYDLYVTYDVKPEYAQAYTGAATAVATTVNYGFLIRQDGKLAKAENATTLTTIESSSTGIDSGSNSGLDDVKLYWCLKPNFDIDTEMGYEYGNITVDTEKENNPLTEAATNQYYQNTGKSGFDPYNIQIYNKNFNGAYFTTNATAADIVNGQYIATTVPAGDGTVALEAKVGTEGKFQSTITVYDSKTLKITNQTFMAVQDANGNMRLMPRFDHEHVTQDFTTLTTQADVQPVDDKAHPQTTWLLRPVVYTYYVIDNQGREALRYTLMSSGAPKIPSMFQSPFANNFKFYATYGTPGDITTLSNEITGAFADATGLTDNKVYVRYTYNADSDIDALLKGMWYNAKLNGADVEVTSGGVINNSLGEDATPEQKKAHRWRFMQSAGSDRDPYAVTLWNGTPTTESSNQRYILMGHSDGTGYALMGAGNASTSVYKFLDGSSTPALTEQTNYTTAGTIGATKKLTLTPVLGTDNVIYKIITHSGKVALTSEEIAVNESSVLDLPEWMESPLMKSDAYIFYSAADVVGSVYTPKGEPTTSPKTLDVNVVYVRYDYEKSKKAVENFGMDDFEGLPYNYAPLDLSGKVAYTMGLSSTARGRIWSVNSSTHAITQTDVAANTELTKAARLWYFTGDDPYEVTLKNPAYSPTKVLAGKTPNSSANWDSAPNDKYPLVYMKDPTDATYTLNTFMVLKYNPNETTSDNDRHHAGTLKLYVTGNDQQYIAESNSLAGGVYLYTDALHYKDRLAASGEPINPKTAGAQNEMIIYSSFFYRPVLTYHIITNSGKEALKGYSLTSGTTVEMPEMYQSPLLNSGDFTYYTAATETTGTWTVTEDSKTAATTTIASLATKNFGDIYVRYEYGASPFKIATNIDDAAEDNTHLSWIDEKVLDLSGKTWYTIADMQRNFTSHHGEVFGANSESNFKQTAVNALTNGRAPSSKEYLWRLEGNDPYAVKIYNAQYEKYLSVADNNNRNLTLQANGTASNFQTFMILEAYANDNAINRYAKDEDGETLYQLQRWTVLIPTGTKYFVPVTTGNSSTASLSARNTWEPTNYSDYNIRMSSGEVVTRKIFHMGGGSTSDYCVEFIKAPVTRKYHYHAIKYDSEGNKVGQTWDAVLEHDWLQPVVLEDVIARQFCKYETKGTVSGDNVTPTNVFETRWTLNQEAQFYHNAELTERVKDSNSGQYDVYPEIDLNAVYDIYFKYQIDNEATLKGRTLADMTSTPEQIAADAAYYNDPNGGNGRMGVGYTQQAKWFFMVLDTDENITATGEGDSRSFDGKQMFLRREDDGTVSWMNNAYTLHKNDVDNYNNWSYSRIAEWYQKGDNDAYREGRWLWTFVGDDPYNMRIINFESAAGVKAEGYNVYTLNGAENCYTTITRGTTSTGAETYPIVIPTSEPTANQYWGLCVGEANSTKQTFSLLSTAITNSVDGQNMSQPLYWHIVSRTANKVTTESVEGMLDYVPDQSYAIQLLPYVPVKYQDINLVIKRDDHVAEYNSWKDGKTDDVKRAKLKEYDSGISLLYFTAAERTYVAGDKIDLSKQLSLPLNVRRAFCDYTLYSDDYNTAGGEYEVSDGPYPTTTQATDGSGNPIYDEDGKPVWTYKDKDGNPAPGGAQSIYVKYTVTSDIFLKTAPNKTQVDEMVANNDHVYFMDFPTLDSKGKEITHHAFYDPEATTRIQTGDLSKNKDKNTGKWTPEKKSWDGSKYASNTSDPYNYTQYRTADDRMTSTPEMLKWYFVGDPYKVQVFNTAGAWNESPMTDTKSTVWAANTKSAQLARFNAVETNFQFVSDCVHIRMPNYTNIDNRETLIPTDENGDAMPDDAFPNRNNGKPYINDFYWEVMPTATDQEGTFALRFKEDNELLGYRNVYYYLARDGMTKTYRSSDDTPTTNHINLSYNANNECYESGKYLGYHKANNDYTVIKLVQPVKVYITTNRDADTRYSDKANVTIDEYSGYYGLGEKITGIPRHLQRKYVNYADLTDKYGTTMGEHTLSEANAYYPLADCSAHSSNVFKTGTKINPIFKFSVHYTVDDQTSEGVHLFTPAANPTIPTPEERNSITWLDVKISNSSWLYYDKTNVDGSGVEDKTDVVSNYRRAMYTPKNEGWNSNVSGWTDGLKGLHWAFIGDPYDFTILNRRRYEDGTYSSSPMWLAATKQTIADYKNTEPNDSVVWTATLVNAPTDINTSTATAYPGTGQNTHWSLQMWKTGGNSDFFLRTASLDQTAANADGTNNTDTDNYWRMVARTTTISGNASEFEAIPYSLSNKNKWTSNVNDLTYNNYVNNGMGYSKTSSGLGVLEQLIQINTATSKDKVKDNGDNNCFDAKIEIRSKTGDLRISKDNMEIKYGIATDMLPYSMRRYGCTYDCYLGYTDAANPGTLIYRLRDSNVPMDESESWSTSQAEYDALNAAIAAAGAANVTLTFVYDMDEETAAYFTSQSNALIDEYTWLNSYFEWEQYYSGTNVEVEYYEDVFDHYVYNAQGQIIDAVYTKERKTKIVKNPTTPYITDAYLNSHTTQTAIYADQSVQNDKDQLKWTLVGDPYCFTMTNYDQYLKNQNSRLTLDGTNVVASNIAVPQNFTIAIDKDGNTFLGIFNGTGVDGQGDITHGITFDYASSSDKSLHYDLSDVINANDPTGNTLYTGNIKPFKLANLISYADVLQYHLVVAHQHSLDPTDTHLQNLNASDDAYTEAQQTQRQTLRTHLIEYLKYQGISKHSNSGYYVVGESYKADLTDVIKNMLKEDGTLRDFISYPISDYNVSRVGIGNHPQVPWYMKRQFCKYYLYQRDVMRSKVSDRLAYLKNDNGEYVDYDGNVVDEGERIQLYMDDEHTKPAYEIDWVSIFDVSSWSVWTESDGTDAKYTVTADDVTKWGGGLVAGTYRKIPSGYEEAKNLQGQILTTLKDCHKNRKVVIDVVYDVNTNEFQFATSGRNTYAWYQMMTNNASSGLMNFSYKDGIGARTGLDDHYTNNYLWAPEGDPYGFVLRSRYATINGTGWDDVVVTTTGHLPKSTDYTTYDAATIIDGDANAYNATYTNSANTGAIRFDNKQIIHHLTGEGVATTDGAANAVYEMFIGDASYNSSFLMHPTSAYIDLTNTNFVSYYMTHDTETHKAKLVANSANTLKNNADANWRLATTAEQLWSYFEYAGYVGGLDPVIAQNFSNMELRSKLEAYCADPSMEREYSVLNQARQLVYQGKFYKRGGEELAADASRPTADADLPLRFVSNNLVPMSAGYFRIKGFSTNKLKAAETVDGVYGPRYISSYRFASEVDTKPLHYFETNQESTTIHTFGALTTAKSFTDGTLRGNIELLPVEYDASSIFQFVATGDAFSRWTFGSQDLKVQVDGTATKMSSADGTPFRLDDIGGATITFRTLTGEPSNWDSDATDGVSKNIQTNYLTSNGSNNGNAYSLTVAANNELNQTVSTDIQDTKWRLQPVGIKTDWPYNQMPLRVEVKKGGVDKNGATDKYYYGSLCVPFDSRLGNTTDAAFTMVREITGTSGTITMPSVSQYNDMGNPQYVPATWPVVLRTNKPGHWTEGVKYYVDMYLPYTTPQTLSKADLNDKFKGEYLERTLTNTYMDGVESKTILVFGLPFESHATDHHVYNTSARVGWFTNDNWARETHATDYNANTATDAQRNNKYVFHNKVYYVLDDPAPSRHVIALFDDEEEVEEDEPIDVVDKSLTPWPCDVYDLSGRRVAENETPQTLLKNHPGLPKGVYIFGGRKVVVK